MAVLDVMSGHALSLSVAIGAVVALSSLFVYLFGRPPIPKNAPTFVSGWPVLGSLSFFTSRWDFYQDAVRASHSGNFSFYAGTMPVIGLSGERERKTFFEHRGLAFSEGYAALLGGGPKVKEDNNFMAEDHGNDSTFGAYFNKRLVAMLKGNVLKKGLPQLLEDARTSLDGLAANPAGVTDPFQTIYRAVFQFTMRTVACNEIAEDPVTLDRCLDYFQAIEKSTTTLSILYPWLPTLSKPKQLYAGAQLYMIFKNIVDARNKEGRREDDALQYLLDQGDNITDIITFVLGALFAGQINTGINTAWILCYMACKREWIPKARAEINAAADRYCPDRSLPLKDRLMRVPIEAWESEFPVIDVCLRETIRLQMPGTAFRQNLSGHDIPLSAKGEVIPAGAYVALAVGDIHYDSEIYTSPDDWDPDRFSPERAEDKKKLHSYVGWGVGRHPCLGMRFAKLEVAIYTAFFLAYFEDFQLLDARGEVLTQAPTMNKNNHNAQKPAQKVFLRYQTQQKVA